MDISLAMYSLIALGSPILALVWFAEKSHAMPCPRSLQSLSSLSDFQIAWPGQGKQWLHYELSPSCLPLSPLGFVMVLSDKNSTTICGQKICWRKSEELDKKCLLSVVSISLILCLTLILCSCGVSPSIIMLLLCYSQEYEVYANEQLMNGQAFW